MVMINRWRLGSRGFHGSALAVVAAFATTCVPEQGVTAWPPLPSTALTELAPDSLRERAVGDGTMYRFVWSARGPWAIHLVSAEIARCELDLVVVPAMNEAGTERLRTPLTRMIPGAPSVPLAGVNGDFFRLDNGDPLGSEITETTSRFSTRPAFAWGPGRVPWIGVPERAGDQLAFGPDTIAPGPGGDGTEVVGGYPELLDRGLVVGDLGVTAGPGFASARHPRTAVGYDNERQLLWLVVVDGRQAPRSVGMSLPELASLFLWLGADEALNLDGGGSSAMLLGEQLVNTPSDAEGERPVGNSLWLVENAEGCSP
jgi:hypothetical protein